MAMTDKAALHLRGLRFGYGSQVILSDVNLSVEAGEIAILLGRNGSGKSTLLNLIAGLLHPQQGSIHYRGLNLHSMKPYQVSRLGIGYQMQGGVVFRNLTVEENLAFAQSRGQSARSRALSDYLSSTFPILLSLRRRRAGLLSGGERQTLAIAMIVAQNPSVLLLDEPVAGLSGDLSSATAALISRLCKESGCLAVVAEHSFTFANSLNATRYQLYSQDGAASVVRAS